MLSAIRLLTKSTTSWLDITSQTPAEQWGIRQAARTAG